jgi:hypothetical protein
VSGQPVSLACTPSKLVAAPPECGEHTQEVLGESGFSEDEIAGLRNAKVICPLSPLSVGRGNASRPRQVPDSLGAGLGFRDDGLVAPPQDRHHFHVRRK